MGEAFMELSKTIRRRLEALSFNQFAQVVRFLGMNVAEFAASQPPAGRSHIFETQCVAYGVSIGKVESALQSVVGPGSIEPSSLILGRKNLKARTGLRVFLCYSRKDLAFVRRFRLELESAGLACWMDEKDLDPGKIWLQAIQKAMTECQAAVIFLGWTGLGVTQEREIGMLVERHNAGSFRALVPAKLHPEVVVPNSLQVKDEELLPLELIDLNAAVLITRAIQRQG